MSKLGRFKLILLLLIPIRCISAINDKPFESITQTADATFGIVHSVEVQEGVIWVGADNGLFKIIGSHAEQYNAESSPIKTPVSSLRTNDKGLWVGTYGSGLFFANYSEDNGLVFQTLKGFNSDYILDIQEITKTKIIVRTYEGIFALEYLLDQTEVVKIAEGFTQDLAVLSDSELIYYANNGLYSFDLEKSLTDTVFIESSGSVFKTFIPSTNKGLGALFNDKVLYIKTGTDLNIIELENPLPDFPVFDSIILPSDGALIASEQLRVLTSDSVAIPPFYDPFLNNFTLNVIYDIEATKRGHLIFGGPVFGITWLPKTFDSISFLHENEIPINSRFMGYEKLGNDLTVILFSESLYRMTNSTRSSLAKIESDTSWISVKQSAQGPVGLDQNGAVWSLVFSNPKEINLNKSKLSKLRDIVEIETFAGQLIALDIKGRLFSYLDGESRQLLTDKTVSYAFSTDSTFAVIDENNHLLITKNLQEWFNVDTSEFESHLQLECMAESPSGILYFCSSGHGILSLDANQMKLEAADIDAHFDSNYIRALIFQRDGIGWATTNTGLVRFSTKNSVAQELTTKEGFIDTDFEYEGLLLDESDASLYVIGDNLKYKVNLVKLNSYLDEKLTASNDVIVYKISNYSGAGEDKGVDINLRDRHLNSEIEIQDDVYLTELFFTSTDPIDHKYLRYEYRLIGLSDQWNITPEFSPSVSFSSLPFGNYQFQVRAVDPNSSAVQPITNIDLKVLPPFWLTNTAFFMYAIFLLALYFGTKLWVKERQKNIEELKRAFAKEQTEKIQKRLSKKEFELSKSQMLFASVSIEFRTPLTLIIGWLNQIKRSRKEKDEVTLIDSALQNTKRLGYLVDQLLQIQDLNSVAAIQSENTVDVVKSVNAIVELLKPQLSKKCICVNVKGRSNILLDTKGDSFNSLISQVLVYAIHHSPMKGSVTALIKVRKGVIKIVVSDTGYHVEQPSIDSIFNRDSSISSSTDTPLPKISSTIFEELVSLNAGKVVVESSLNNGFSVILSFPISSKGATNQPTKSRAFNTNLETITSTSEARSSEKVSLEKVGPKDKPKVLIVDENADMRRYLTSLLESKYVCINASNGKEALDMAKTMLPDIVVTDSHTSIIDGISLAESLRSAKRNSDVPIIVLSAVAEQSFKVSCYEARVNHFMVKPFDAQELLLKISNLVEVFSQSAQRQDVVDVEETIDFSDFELPTFKDERQQNFYTKFLMVIQKNYQDDSFDREQASKLLNCADRHLNRKLNSIAGHTFAPFLRQYRLKKAQKLLLLSDSVSNVAFDTGFSSASHFGSCFKDEFGMTPTQYIKQCKN